MVDQMHSTWKTEPFFSLPSILRETRKLVVTRRHTVLEGKDDRCRINKAEVLGKRNTACATYLYFDILVASVLRSRDLLLNSKIVKVQEARFCLSGLSKEVVSRVANRFTLSDANQTQDGSEPDGLLSSENTQSLCPVSLLREAREVQAQAESVLWNRQQDENELLARGVTRNLGFNKFNESATYLAGRPDTGPCKHSLTPVLDLRVP